MPQARHPGQEAFNLTAADMLSRDCLTANGVIGIISCESRRRAIVLLNQALAGQTIAICRGKG